MTFEIDAGRGDDLAERRKPHSGDTASAAADDLQPQVRFQEWVAPHVAVLHSLASREVGRSDAADVVQETLLRAWQRWETYSAERGAPRAWLLAILYDQIRKARRKQFRWQHADADALLDVLAGESSVSESSLDLERVISTLPPRQRQVVCLFYLADMKLDEVARVLRISEGATKSCLHVARANMRKALER